MPRYRKFEKLVSPYGRQYVIGVPKAKLFSSRNYKTDTAAGGAAIALVAIEPSWGRER